MSTNKLFGRLSPRNHTLPVAVCALGISLFAGAPAAFAATLTSGNSELQIDPASADGAHTWRVDGQDGLAQLTSFWRAGDVGQELPVSAISSPVLLMPDSSTLNVTYANPFFSVQIVYNLLGGAPGSGVSALTQQIKVQNLTASPLDFHLFQYADFDLIDPGGESVQLGTDLEGNFNEALQLDGVTEILRSSSSPGANRAEAGFYDSTLGSLTDVNPTTLNNNTSAGIGDVTWTLQYDRTIAVGGTFLVSHAYNLTLTPIPEPSAIALGSLALLGLGIFRRSRH